MPPQQLFNKTRNSCGAGAWENAAGLTIQQTAEPYLLPSLQGDAAFQRRPALLIYLSIPVDEDFSTNAIYHDGTQLASFLHGLL